MASSHHHIETRRAQVMSALRDANKPLGPKDLAALIGTSPTTVSHELRDLLRDGEVARVGHGKYEVARHVGLAPVSNEADSMTFPYLEAGPGAGGAEIGRASCRERGESREGGEGGSGTRCGSR